MHIALISQYFYPEQFSNNAISRELVRRGHDVSAFPCVPNYPAGRFFPGYSNSEKREEHWEGVTIHRAYTIPRGRGALSLVSNFLTYPFAATFTMWRKMRSRADVSFVSMPSPLFQAFAGIALRWRTGTPCVYWVQDIWPESLTFTLRIRAKWLVSLLNAVCGWLYRRADLILVQSEAFTEMIARFGVPRERIRVLPNTAPEMYRPMSAGEAPLYAERVPQEGFRLMFAGNIGESQDFDTLIATASLLRHREHLKWIIVGSGRDEPRVRKLVAENGLEDRFHFLGRYAEGEMPAIFAHADAMIVSLKNVPIFGLTVPYKTQCYMACGKPIVASINGEGARIIVAAQAGVVAPASDPDALAVAITRMMDSSVQQLKSYAENSRRYFEENYSSSKVYGDLEDALRFAATMNRG